MQRRRTNGLPQNLGLGTGKDKEAGQVPHRIRHDAANAFSILKCVRDEFLRGTLSANQNRNLGSLLNSATVT